MTEGMTPATPAAEAPKLSFGDVMKTAREQGAAERQRIATEKAAKKEAARIQREAMIKAVKDKIEGFWKSTKTRKNDAVNAGRKIVDTISGGFSKGKDAAEGAVENTKNIVAGALKPETLKAGSEFAKQQIDSAKQGAKERALDLRDGVLGKLNSLSEKVGGYRDRLVNSWKENISEPMKQKRDQIAANVRHGAEAAGLFGLGLLALGIDGVKTVADFAEGKIEEGHQALEAVRVAAELWSDRMGKRFSDKAQEIKTDLQAAPHEAQAKLMEIGANILDRTTLDEQAIAFFQSLGERRKALGENLRAGALSESTVASGFRSVASGLPSNN